MVEIRVVYFVIVVVSVAVSDVHGTSFTNMVYLRLSLQWCHNDHNGVSNHQPNGCLLKRLFRRRSKKTSKLRVAGLYLGNSPGPVNSPHKGPVTRKMFPFDDVIMYRVWIIASHNFQRDMIASIPRYWSDQCDVSNDNKDRQHDDLSVSVDLIGVLDRHWGEDLNEWLYPTVFVDVISYSVMMLM